MKVPCWPWEWGVLGRSLQLISWQSHCLTLNNVACWRKQSITQKSFFSRGSLSWMMLMTRSWQVSGKNVASKDTKQGAGTVECQKKGVGGRHSLCLGMGFKRTRKSKCLRAQRTDYSANFVNLIWKIREPK